MPAMPHIRSLLLSYELKVFQVDQQLMPKKFCYALILSMFT